MPATPIPAEHLAEHSAAAAEKAAVDEARRQLDAREAAAQARIDAAYQAIGAALQPGEVRLLVHMDAPSIRKSMDGVIEHGTIHSIFPDAQKAQPV